MSNNSCAPAKIGLIGAGNWGRNYIKSIQALDGLELSALYSQNPQSSQLVNKECQIFSSLQEFFAFPMDGVIISSPPEAHFLAAKMALQKNLPMIIEKPLCLNFDETKLLHRLAHEKKALILVDHIYLFNSAFQLFVTEVKKRKLPIQRILACGGNWGPSRETYSALWDYGPHDLSMLLHLFPGEVKLESCKKLNQGEKVHDGNYEVCLKIQDQFTAQIQIGNMFARKLRFLAVYYENEILVFNDLLNEKIESYGHNATYEQLISQDQALRLSNLETNFRSPLLNLLDIFREGIVSEKNPSDSIKSTKVKLWGTDMAMQVAFLLKEVEERLDLHDLGQ